MARTPLIAANWKMNLTHTEAAVLAKALTAALDNRDRCEVVICPPFTALAAVSAVLLPGAAHGPVGHYGAVESAASRESDPGRRAGSADPATDLPYGDDYGRTGIRLGAQNAHWESAGAFTGEISVAMLRALGCRYVIVGHSERRHLFGEDDATVVRKVQAVFAGDLVPILCVGETEPQRREGQTEAVIGNQLDVVLTAIDGMEDDSLAKLVIAYEPVWAIGSGQAAHPEDAAEMARFIRDRAARRLGTQVGQAVRVLYGGSVNADNAAAFLAQDGIDGALVGGAGLRADSFTAIVGAAGGVKST